MLGHDIRRMSPEIKAILTHKEAIAIDQDLLGKQGRRVLQHGTTGIWTKPLSGGETAVALFNRGETPAEIRFRWQEIGLEGVTRVRDVWRQRNAAAKAQDFSASVSAHGSVLLRVRSK